jgi:hypothetical protein
MNTDTMIALAIDTHADRVRAGDRERRAGQAGAAHERRSLLRSARYSIGAALIGAGAQLQGVATALPEPPSIVPAGQAGH